ncbi:MAG TPA: urease accessory protein UreE [Cellvibrionaceae bacterium]|nr:urease accessory protein UreE [Cellvibrionaceae bacterium]
MTESSLQFAALLEADALAEKGVAGNLRVVANFSERQKSRHKTQTQCGKPVGWFLPRGIVLKEGDVLLCRNGETIAISAAPEDCSQVTCDDALTLMTAAYHLGNRHVPLQIGPGLLRYQRDHVLDAMVEGLGLEVQHLQLPFQPESGAYHGKSILQLGGGHHH